MSIEEDLREIFKRIKRIQDELGLVNLDEKGKKEEEKDKKEEKEEEKEEEEEEKEKEPEIRKFAISNSDYVSESGDETVDPEDIEFDEVSTDEESNKSDSEGGKKKSAKKLKSKSKTAKTAKKSTGGKSKFNVFMSKKLKELKKKYPKKSHAERFKMAAGMYKKSNLN